MKLLRLITLGAMLCSFIACAHTTTHKADAKKSLRRCSATYPPVCDE